MSTATVSAPFRRDDRLSRPRQVQRSARPLEARQPRPVRLTRRGRLVVLMAVLATALAALVWMSAPAASTGATHHPASHTVVVGGGETLWDIAQQIAPGQDPRTVIADIVDLNDLSDAGSIRIGQALVVPQY
jgi:Tfp pilus assembly protein FimV